ncbi:FR47-like protein [Nocardioides sp. AX2bis]|nr:FR47-like protein [Nocardioides sp. AX2bis]
MRLRRAGPDDAPLLRDLERAANLVALAHVFPPAEHPFPDEAVEQRWVAALREPAVVAWVADGDRGEPVGFVAHDDTWVRQVAVRPEAWGAGLGSALLDRAVAGVRAGGGVPRLWCLRRNERALGLYARRGWRPTGTEREAVYAPHPVEVELVLAGSGA